MTLTRALHIFCSILQAPVEDGAALQNIAVT